MTLRPWPRHRQLTDSQRRYILTGLPRALEDGWCRYEWADECAALFGVTRDVVVAICFQVKGACE